MSADVRHMLRDAYDSRANDRDCRATPEWETKERDALRLLLRQEHKRALLELGAATGSDATVFEADGLKVVCIDLSPEMIRRCRAKGLPACVMDVADLGFPSHAFDAVYAMNCLVHVPKARLSQVLAGVAEVLKPNGLFYIGLYGGRQYEGVWESDYYTPRRFFSHHTDEDWRRMTSDLFDLHSFDQIPHGWDGLHFQSLTLRKRAMVSRGE